MKNGVRKKRKDVAAFIVYFTMSVCREEGFDVQSEISAIPPLLILGDQLGRDDRDWKTFLY